MTKGQEYLTRKQFIEETLKNYLNVKADFDYIRYAKTKLTDSEYIRIGDITGKAVTLNITAMSLEEIGENIARLVLKATPYCVVTDTEELRAISSLFVHSRQ